MSHSMQLKLEIKKFYVKNKAIYYLLSGKSDLSVLLAIFSFHPPPPLLYYEKHIFSREERQK